MPELNPLLNPVLGANMGRWAEVYFTNPPEKREEAVLDLLRELEGEPAGVQTAAGVADRKTREVQASPKPALDPQPPENAEQQGVVCESCGGTNILGNRFCGMCGTPIGQTIAEPPEAATAAARAFTERDRDGNDQRDRHEEDFDAYRETITTYPQDFTQSSWPPRPDLPSLIPEYEPASSRYRMYFGAVVAILIAGLLYVAWRGTSATSGNARTLPQSAPAVEPPPAVQPQTPPSTAQVNPDQALPSNSTTPQQRTSRAVSSNSHRRPEAARETISAPLSQPNQSAAGPLVAPLQGNGTEELTVAESYLNGTGGRARDSSEAAKWLWRSMGKQNAAATLLLSDLYLRGDGVPKNCDQARLLLDAAARKGAPGAGERIRNLSAGGCP